LVGAGVVAGLSGAGAGAGVVVVVVVVPGAGVVGCPAGGVVVVVVVVVPGAVLVSDLVCGVGAFFSGAGAVFFGVWTGVCFLQPLNVNATNAITANAVRTTFLMVIPFRKTYSLALSANISACQDP
jgi:hypothetical protein